MGFLIAAEPSDCGEGVECDEPEGDAVDAGDVGDLAEGDRRGLGVTEKEPGEAGEESSSEPFAGDPDGGDSEHAGDDWGAGEEACAADDESGPSPVCAAEDHEGKHSGPTDIGHPPHVGGEEECAGDPAIEEGGFLGFCVCEEDEPGG